MKIGIVTIPDMTNYGNRLQNYAVSHVLREKYGCHVVSLASYKEKAFENGNYVLWAKNFLARQLCVFPELAETRFGCRMTRWANFFKWNKKYIPTRKFYEEKSLPARLNEEYDLFFAGSDQIWNYRFPGTKYDDYFLKFADDKKKAAISGSFGVESIPDEWKQTYIDGLSGFSHISVREYAGAKIVKELIDRDVPVLIDPVMLLSREEWMKVAKKPRVDCGKPYILKYYLGDEAEEEKINRWAEANGYAVYELLNEDIPELYSAGPGEFISLIVNASLVASDSFHCIAFSIIFKKPFLVYARLGSGNYMTSRLDTLLDKFGFGNRWKHMLKPEEYLTCDFSQVDAIMQREQENAFAYIQSVLNSAK